LSLSNPAASATVLSYQFVANVLVDGTNKPPAFGYANDEVSLYRYFSNPSNIFTTFAIFV